MGRAEAAPALPSTAVDDGVAPHHADRPVIVHGDGTDANAPAIASQAVLAERRLAALRPGRAARSRTKRAVDLLVSGSGLVVLSPLMALIALGVRRSSHGPALFRQDRVGLCGKPFIVLKFRTMEDGADEQLGALLETQGGNVTPLFKVEDDPRITRFGHLLRRTSLDELPQLVNVWRGEMSLVGPRPQRMPEVELYEPEHYERLTAPPGLTGAWQVGGRSDLPWEQAVALDLDYVRNWSPRRDAVIMLRTVKVVLSGHGAR